MSIPMILNRLSFTLSVIGRVLSPGTDFSRVPRALPAMILGLDKLPQPFNCLAGSQDVSAGRRYRRDAPGAEQ
jgi:hypothetical protein